MADLELLINDDVFHVVHCGLGPTDGYYMDRVPAGGQESADRLPFMTIDY
jgi:hypothetical protein